MPINVQQLRDYVVRTTLDELGLWSPSAENLLLGTCAQESALGTYLHQTNGPALGIFQMEDDTFNDIWANFLKYKIDLANKINSIASQDPNNVIFNLKYAAAMCRVHYLRVKAPLPDATDVLGLANYWKQYYNTPVGKGSVQDFIKNYNLYIGSA